MKLEEIKDEELFKKRLKELLVEIDMPYGEDVVYKDRKGEFYFSSSYSYKPHIVFIPHQDGKIKREWFLLSIDMRSEQKFKKDILKTFQKVKKNNL